MSKLRSATTFVLIGLTTNSATINARSAEEASVASFEENMHILKQEADMCVKEIKYTRQQGVACATFLHVSDQVLGDNADAYVTDHTTSRNKKMVAEAMTHIKAAYRIMIAGG